MVYITCLSCLTSVGRLGRHDGRSADEVERIDQRVAAALEAAATDALDGREERLEISLRHHAVGGVERLLDVRAESDDADLLLEGAHDDLDAGVVPDHTVAIRRQLRTVEDELLVGGAVQDGHQRRRRLDGEPEAVLEEGGETVDLRLELRLGGTDGDLHLVTLSAPEYRDIGLISHLMRQGS